MPKISTDLRRHALSGATMGTRWTAVFHAPPAFEVAPVQAALQAAVAMVDAQMSTWRPDSDLMRLARAPVGAWVTVPPDLARVLALGLAIGRASDGAFDIGMGDAVRAWGFGALAADAEGIRAALRADRRPAHQVLEIDGTRVRKNAALAPDLNGIAKGHGVDRLAEVLQRQGIAAGLVGIDGEMRAMGLRPDGTPWVIAVESPDPDRRVPHSVLALQDAAVATSGDYRHWVSVQGRRLSHTMDPRRGAPLAATPASVTVIAPSCAEADGWATALMVAGSAAGAALARKAGVEALFLDRTAEGLRETRVGRLFAGDGQAERS